MRQHVQPLERWTFQSIARARAFLLRCPPLVLGLLWLAPVQAEVLLSEDFQYSGGFLEEVSGGKWTRHSGGTNEIKVIQGLVSLAQANSEDDSALLVGQPLISATTAELYLKFVVRLTKLPSVTGGYFLHLKGASPSAGFRTRIWALTGGAEAGSYRLGISSIAGTAPISVYERDLLLETDYTVVASLQLTDGSSSLWIDPISEGDQNITSDSGDPVPITALALRQGSGIGSVMLGKLAVTTSFAEALRWCGYQRR